MEIADFSIFCNSQWDFQRFSYCLRSKSISSHRFVGDHRLPAKTYKQWYGKEPASEDVIAQFSYGLTEFSNLTSQKFVANPGCYATATELALIPLLQKKMVDPSSVIVDAKSGLSGAGKAPTSASHFVHIQGNYVTYKLNKHQHIPEIVQMLQQFDEPVEHIQFSTSLLPLLVELSLLHI